jgi:rRNA processing protein Gar1
MLHEVGKVLQKVEELIIVEANNCVNLVDLDNWLFNSDRECMGFVIDIFGRVEHPYYAIKLLHNVESKLENSESIVGKPLFSADGCKTLTEDDINSIKEKSSMYQ